MIQPTSVHETLKKFMLVDGFDLVLDLKKSKGSKLYDAKHDRYMVDGFSFFASAPIGCNHPAMTEKDFVNKIGTAAINKPTNSDVYTQELAEFVETFGSYAMPAVFKHLFFISGGALAVENGLKTAFDWKIQKNMENGEKKELGNQVIHFKEAFHGRTGYTLSLTNTFSPEKTKYFPKFQWPRIINPKIRFPLNQENLSDVKEREEQAVNQIQEVIEENPHDISSLIIEPIQGEGGDNHFRAEFFQQLRSICDNYDIMFILDEVQSGMGLTGEMWAYEHFDVTPDIVCFGKKTQVCGIMVTSRVDEVKNNVFNVSSRINSTWGGNLVDMVRCQKYLEIIQEENLIKNAETQGKRLLQGLRDLEQDSPMISNTRGRGLMCAFDCATSQQRDDFKNMAYNQGLVILGCGEKTIRFRPALNITEEEVDEMISIVKHSANKLSISSKTV